MVRRLLQLYVGLGLYGETFNHMFIRSIWGLAVGCVSPWGGITAGMTIGTVIILTGAAVLLLWIPLRQMPGWNARQRSVLLWRRMPRWPLSPSWISSPISDCCWLGHCAERDSNPVYRCRVQGGPTRWTDDRHSRPAGAVNPQRSNLN